MFYTKVTFKSLVFELVFCFFFCLRERDLRMISLHVYLLFVYLILFVVKLRENAMVKPQAYLGKGR